MLSINAESSCRKHYKYSCNNPKHVHTHTHTLYKTPNTHTVFTTREVEEFYTEKKMLQYSILISAPQEAKQEIQDELCCEIVSCFLSQ